MVTLEEYGVFLHALLGDGPGLAPLRALLIERTEGNPFFLEESVRTLVETKVLVGERGAYRLARPVESLQVPPTVQALLAARIDRLPPEEKGLLQIASVIGESVRLALLQDVAGVGEDALRRGLAHLGAAEFLYEASLFPDVEYTFKHGLTCQVAYGSLLVERRRALHARVAEAMESLFADRLGEHVERLADHALRGETWEKALAYCHQAGAKAFARSVNREAVVRLEQALSALGHLPESRETLGQAIDLRFELRHALQPVGEHEKVVERLHEAEALARALDDQGRLGWASAYLGQYFNWMGDPERAVESAQRALALASDLRDRGLQVVASFFSAQALFQLGDYRQAAEHCRRNVAVLQGDLTRERFGLTGLPSVLSRMFLTYSLSEQGEFAEAVAVSEEGLRVAEAAGQPYSVIAASGAIAFAHLSKGEFSAALPLLERGRALCETWNIPFLLPGVILNLGWAYAHSGRMAEALPLLERPTESIARPFYPRLLRLAEAYLVAGRLEEAERAARGILDEARAVKAQGTEALALCILAEIAARREPVAADIAEESYGQALALAGARGMRPLVAHCHLGLGKLYAAHGQARAGARAPRAPRRRCTARWTCASGWSRRRRRGVAVTATLSGRRTAPVTGYATLGAP